MKYFFTISICCVVLFNALGMESAPPDSLQIQDDVWIELEDLSFRESFDSVFLLAKELLPRVKNDSQMVHLYFYIGTALEKSGQNDSALAIYDQLNSLKLSERQGIKLHRNIGNIFYLQGAYEKALNKYLLALPLANAFGDTELTATIKNNIGLVYWRLKKHDEAIEILNETLAIRKEIKSKLISSTISTLANVYYDLGDINKVLQMDLKSLELNLQGGNNFRIAIDYNNIGEDYLSLDNYEKGEEYLKKALALRRKIKHTHGEMSTLVNLSFVAINNENFKEAERLLYRSLFLADSIQASDQKYRILPYLRNFEEKRGNYEKALAHFDEYVALKDSMFNERKSRQIEEMIAKYESEKKEIENEQLKNEMLLQSEQLAAQSNIQYLLVLVIVLIIILLIVVYRNYRLKTTANIEITKQRNDLDKLNKAKSRFFSIISHDIRGPLSTLVGFSNLIKLHIEDSKRKNIDDQLNTYLGHMEAASGHVMTLLDSLMKWAMKEEGLIPYHPASINLKDLISENIELLTPKAVAKGIDLNKNVPDNLNAWVDRNSFLTILRNLTGNALKFTDTGGQVTLEARRINGKVELKVQDSGIGIPQNELNDLYRIGESNVRKGTKGEPGSGLGLNLVHDFVKMNQGELEVESEVGKGTIFKLYFPVSESV